MKVLLHACCGPCASACVPRLKELGHDVTMYFANSNISDEAEFEKRLAAARTLADADEVAIAAADYDHGEWLREVAAGYEDAPEKGARCARCFRYNLAKTAAYAAAHGFDAFTTSLTVSPHKVSEAVFEAGRAAEAEGEGKAPDGAGKAACAAGKAPDGAGKVAGATGKAPDGAGKVAGATGKAARGAGVVFLEENFKKREGFKRSLVRSAELGLYRQGWCGCEFSKREGRSKSEE